MKLFTFRRSDIAVALSVLSVEPYGMKQLTLARIIFRHLHAFSALGRAVWDETLS